ncbi:hypothetical protein IWGMT90018_01830 [Mycobacterium kiyosense]|nr:hypothetical protein IWGMT90018_01830 [Mycobacterium kiyosense]
MRVWQHRGRACDHAVIIVGAGPTGLMLAGELALAGVDVAVVERRANQELVESRAGGLHSRSLEILDQRGIVDRFLSVGQVSQLAGYAQIRLEIGDLPTPHPYGLALWQREIERILAEWVDELAVPIRRGSDVTGVAQHGTGVDVRLCDGTMLRAQYVVGCDGGRSAIRRAAGIEFPGWDPTTSYLIAEAELAPGAQPPWGIHRDALGIHALSRTGDAGPARIMVTEPRIGASSGPTLADLREGLVAVFGSDYGIHSIRWISRFSDLARQAAAYRDERILLAGDAAHVHHPIGGQGLNTGLQDAVNLGWKLAQVVNGGGLRYAAGYLSQRTASGSGAGAAQRGGADGIATPRRPHPRRVRHRVRPALNRPGPQTIRRDDVRTRHTLRPRRGGTRCWAGACPTSNCAPAAAERGSSRCYTTRGRSCSTWATRARSAKRRIACGWYTRKAM